MLYFADVIYFVSFHLSLYRRPEAHRHISNILLTHVSNAWGYPLPEAQFFYRQSNVYVGNRMCPERLDSSRYHWRSLSAPTALALYSNPPSFRQQYSDSNGTHHRELQTENYHVDCSSVSREVAQPQPLAINFGNVFNNWTPSNESDYFWEPYTACDFQAKDRRSRNSYKRGFRCWIAVGSRTVKTAKRHTKWHLKNSLQQYMWVLSKPVRCTSSFYVRYDFFFAGYSALRKKGSSTDCSRTVLAQTTCSVLKVGEKRNEAEH